MQVWDALLQIRQLLLHADQFPGEISIQFEPEVQVQLAAHADACIRLKFSRIPTGHENPLHELSPLVNIENQTGLSAEELNALAFYLPYAVLGYFGRKQQKCFAISHFAQTLDGRIATCTGDSKWIGNEENLLHAHRMRALCDGIAVGAATIRNDNPRLTVRMVKGHDPVKVVIGGYEELDENQYHAIGPDTLRYHGRGTSDATGDNTWVSESEEMDMGEILEHLQRRNIYSVYIEGGAFTTSTFIQQSKLDQIQLHFAPKIFGSGVTSFAFGGVSDMQDAVTFKHSRFMAVGNEMMFVGNL